jgi:cell division protein FtsZ
MDGNGNAELSMAKGARIKVIGVGGGGGNAVNNMISSGFDGVEFIAANTDFQVLEQNLAPVRIQLGTSLTKGLGAGGNPEVGAKAAEEDSEKIREAIGECDMAFITAGLGGGTGTGAAPKVAQLCKESGILTVAVATKPFGFEGRVRMRNAEDGVKKLGETVDTLITIPNDRLTSMAERKATLLEMFKKADDVLLFAVKGISDLITNPGLINADFSDVRTVMSEMGLALMGTGIGRGESRAAEAAQAAISSPLLEDVTIQGARAVLVNICAGPDLGMLEFQEVSQLISEEVDEEANIILGTALDPGMDEELRVTVIATGIGKNDKVRPLRTPSARRNEQEPVFPGFDNDVRRIPAVKRREAEREKASEEPFRRRSGYRRYKRAASDEEDLSIPTFIRRQAD